MPQFGSYPSATVVNPVDTVLINQGGLVKQAASVLVAARVATIADLRLLSVTGMTAASVVSVSEFSTPGDGGGGNFQYVPASVAVDNNGTIIAPASGTGRWVRIYSGDANPKWFGAKGDGSTNDLTPLQACVNISYGGSMFLPSDGTYAVDSELVVDMTQGPITIWSHGATIKATDVSNKCMHVTGNAGVTTNEFRLDGVKFASSTSGTSAALLHLDGIARFTVTNCDLIAATKATYAIRCTAAQQGEISGSTLIALNGILLEASGGVQSNGIEIHGNTFDCSAKNAILVADDCSFHSNHLTSAALNIDATSVNGMLAINYNHIEPIGATNNGIVLRSGTKAELIGNMFYGQPGTTDINVLSGAGPIRIVGNLIDANMVIAAGANDVVFAFNSTGGTCTDAGTRTINFANRAFSGTPLTGTTLLDQLTILSQAGAGPILDLQANPLVNDNWGMKVTGAGAAKDVYVQLQDAVIAGNTTGSVINIKSGPGGTRWAAFNAAGARGDPMIIASGAVGSVAAGEVGISGQTQTTVGGAGGASALPGTPRGYIKINVAGTTRVIPFYDVA